MKTITRSLAFLTLCAVLGLPCLAQDSGEKTSNERAPAANKTKSLETEPAKPWYKEKETWGALTGIVALLGTTLPLIAKSFESVSLVSRRKKELQHIEDLASLMDKIKKENVLSPGTMENVSKQIEAEVKSALDQLDKNRESRQKALEVRDRAVEKKKVAEQSDLPIVRRIFLLYLPHGVGAWVAHGLAFLYASIAIVTLFSFDAAKDDGATLGGAGIIVAICWVYAWFARNRWKKEQVIEMGTHLGRTRARPTPP